MADPVWRVRDPSSLRLRRWDRDFVAFHIASGDTHLFDPALGLALEHLLDQPATLATLAAHVAERTELDNGPELELHLVEALGQLQEMGLLVRDGGA